MADYHYPASAKLRLFLPCLRQRLRPRRYLIAGPYVGEFGYELMQWQGYLRARRASYEKTYVLTFPGRDYLYEDCEVHYHQVELRTAGYNYGGMPPAERHRMAHEFAARLGVTDYDIFDTTLLVTRYHKMLFWRQEFRLFREPPKPGGIRDVAFHFRAIDKTGHDRTRNFRRELAGELVQLGRAAGWRMIAIGHPNYSFCPDGVEDFRNIDLRETISALCSVRLLAGELSGPLHLANLCGVPTAYFAEGQWRIDYPPRWNPFRVPLYVVANDTMQPPGSLVFAKVQDALSDLAKRTENFQKPAYTLPAQPIAWV